MIRPPQHETDSKGEALLLTAFAALGWAVNQITKDYGRDFEVEVFRSGKTTGMTFNVQLKSSESPSYSSRNEFASLRLDTPNARYLAIEMRHPVFVIQADVPQKRLFWSALQMDGALLAHLSKKPNASSCTIRVPLANELPSTSDRLVQMLGHISTVLASRRLMEIPTAAFTASTASMTESSELSKSLRNKSDALDLMHVQELTASGDFGGARSGVQAVLSSQQSSVESKFFALLVEEKNERVAAATAGASAAEQAKVFSETAVKLQKLMRHGPGALKYYSLLFRLAAEFYQLVREDWGLYLNWKVHHKTEDLWWRAELRFRRAEISDRIIGKYNQFVRVVRWSERTSYQSALPLALLRIVDGATTLIVRLELEEMPQAAVPFRKSVFEICKLACAIAVEFGDENAHVRAAVSAGLLSRDREADCVIWAKEEIERVSGDADRDWGRATFADQARHLMGEELPGDIYKVPVEQQIYENMASALGIDVADPENPFAEMVKIGIDDLDPTRVLKDCDHLFVTLSRRGPGLIPLLIALQLQLPTMGAKILHCTLHRYTGEGATLDGTYRRFQEDYCSKCPDKSPRANDWQYSPEWQEAENERNKEFMAGPRRPTHNPLPPPPPPHVWKAMNEDGDDEMAGT